MIDRNKESFIEESALIFEALGLTRMAGRIIGYLLVSSEEIISFNNLTAKLKASKSSISTNLRMLQNTGFIKMVTLPADRKTYYELNHDIDWGELMIKKMKTLNLYRVILNKAYVLRENKNDKTSAWTQNSVRFYEWIDREMVDLLQKYKQWENSERPK